MSKTRESSLWAWLRDGSITMRPDLDMSRIENTVDEGTPDVEGYYQGQFWCELKALARPVKPSTKIDLEVDTEQVRWHRRRFLAGGYSWFFIQVGSGHSAKRYLIPGYRCMELQKKQLESTLEKWSVLDPSKKAPNYLKMMGK